MVAHIQTLSCCDLSTLVQLKDYVEQVLQLHAEKDELMLQLELLQHKQQQQQQQQPTTAVGLDSGAESAMEQQLLELRLQKEQAVAAAVRLKQQLQELFHAATAGAVTAGDTVGGQGVDAAEARPSGRPGSSAGTLVDNQGAPLCMPSCRACAVRLENYFSVRASEQQAVIGVGALLQTLRPDCVCLAVFTAFRHGQQLAPQLCRWQQDPWLRGQGQQP
jgi:hypothetical protein